MVEPFAAVIFNKLLTGRSTLKYPSSFNSVARVVTSSSTRNPVGPDFFSPQPRRVKGKDKFESSSEGMVQLYKPTFALVPCGQRRHFASEGVPVAQHEAPRHSGYTAAEVPATTPATHSTPYAERSPEILRSIQEFERVSQTPRAKFDMDEAWEVFRDVEELSLPLASRLGFVDRYISAAELHYRLETDDTQLHEWGRRAAHMLETISSHIAPHTQFDQWRLCLLTRSNALLGNIETAARTLHDADDIPLPYHHKAGIPYAYEMIISAIARYKDNAHAIEFIAEQWSNIGSHLDFKLSSSHHASQERAGRSLRVVAYRIAAEVVDASPFLERDGWDKKRRENVGCFFVDALCYAHMAREAREVLVKMQKLNLHVPQPFQLTVVRFLARQASLVKSAIEVHASIPAQDHDLPYLQTGLYVHARQGNTEVAQKYFSDILAIGPPAPDDIASLIHGYAIADNIDQVNALFNQFFPLAVDGKRMNSPGLQHYAGALYAHSRQGDQAGITFWLQDLANTDLVPDDHIFTIVLNAFAHAGDIDSVMAILEQMRSAGIKPNLVTYTIIITLLAHRKDPIGAEDIFKRALNEGIVPDTRMIVAMMNAHVEAGSWKGVIRAYDYLIASRATTLSIDVYNTLMKAYILIGAPFSVVYKFFKRLERSKAKPDAYTYSLLVQSACDSGLMDIASDIYYDMESLSQEQPDRGLNINVYILTILMAGFLQHGDKIRAKGVYDEMRAQGIQPTPITFGTIIKAYGNDKSKESLRIAEEFVASLVAVPESERVWRKPKYDSKSALHHLYGPVMSAYVKMQKPEEVERVLQNMLNEGAPPSLGTLSALLDVHRRTLNIDAVLKIWPRIYEMGMELTKRDWSTQPEDVDDIRGIRGNVLCVPLSIYIDALSAAGRHSEIATVWKDFRARGFSFDSHNWNHLVVALVRAGQPERAFEVVEKVIIPFQELSSRSIPPRDPTPSSPLLSDLRPKDTDVIEEAPGEPPRHSLTKRVLAAKIATARTARMEGWSDEEPGHDFAHHLHILHQISPSWATWRPHNAALTPIVPDDDSVPDPDYDERPEAREILNRIYNNYPKTVGVVLNYEAYERQRLESDYDEEYNWG
ncbi:hypothetical protein FPV67DRAFT_1714557 [Lyophyllum atratum]|nr:hypothetical protein FPV67DRAFT_1714557 [Lyophyllum atratum]